MCLHNHLINHLKSFIDQIFTVHVNSSSVLAENMDRRESYWVCAEVLNTTGSWIYFYFFGFLSTQSATEAAAAAAVAVTQFMEAINCNLQTRTITHVTRDHTMMTQTLTDHDTLHELPGIVKISHFHSI